MNVVLSFGWQGVGREEAAHLGWLAAAATNESMPMSSGVLGASESSGFSGEGDACFGRRQESLTRKITGSPGKPSMLRSDANVYSLTFPGDLVEAWHRTQYIPNAEVG